MTDKEQTEKEIANIQKILELRDTQDLIEIWMKKDRKEWTAEAFEAMERILKGRLGELPHQNPEHPLPDVADDPERVEQASQALVRSEDSLDRMDFEDALQASQEAIRLAPHLAAAYNFQGLAYDGMGKLGEAIASYREAVRLDPELEEALENLKEAQKEQDQNRRLPQASQHLEQAIDFVDKDELDSALTECELAIQEAPDYAPAYNYKGMILEELGKFAEAIEIYQSAVQLDPQFYAAIENLGNARIRWQEEQYILISKGDFEVLQEGPGLGSAEDKIIDLFLDVFQAQNTDVNEVYDPEAPALYLDEKSILLPGWPGYRTRPGRSGYDYLDTNYEWGHMQGVLLRFLFTGRFRTHNPIYLFLMLLIGIFFLLPGLLIINSIIFIGDIFVLILLLTCLFCVAIGIALLANVVISLLNWNSEGSGSITGVDG